MTRRNEGATRKTARIISAGETNEKVIPQFAGKGRGTFTDTRNSDLPEKERHLSTIAQSSEMLRRILHSSRSVLGSIFVPGWRSFQF